MVEKVNLDVQLFNHTTVRAPGMVTTKVISVYGDANRGQNTRTTYTLSSLRKTLRPLRLKKKTFEVSKTPEVIVNLVNRTSKIVNKKASTE